MKHRRPVRNRTIAFFSSLTVGGITMIAVPALILAGAATTIVAVNQPPAPQQLKPSSNYSLPAISRDVPTAISSSASPKRP